MLKYGKDLCVGQQILYICFFTKTAKQKSVSILRDRINSTSQFAVRKISERLFE